METDVLVEIDDSDSDSVEVVKEEFAPGTGTGAGNDSSGSDDVQVIKEEFKPYDYKEGAKKLLKGRNTFCLRYVFTFYAVQ